MSNANVSIGAATLAAKSGNVKIRSARGKGEVATTYVSIQASCPKSCALKSSGECYAQGGQVGMYVRKIEARSKGRDSRGAATDEASCIDAAFTKGVPQDGARGGRDLRLHTAGDCRTSAAAIRVSEAVARFKRRGGGDAWTYTHAWRTVPRKAWTGVSVLASVDNLGDIADAHARGYAPARVVSTFASSKAWVEAGVRWIPCPAQTTDNTGCADCRLCMDADGLHARRSGIAFAAHGMRAGKLRRRLEVVS